MVSAPLAPVSTRPGALDLGSIPTTAPRESRVGSRVERRLEMLLQGCSPKCPPGSFSFWENPPAQSYGSLLQGRACPLAQPTSPARPGTVLVRVSHGPTLHSPQPVPTVSVGLPLLPYSPPCDLKQPGLSWCCSSLVWQGREPLAQLSPRSPAAGPGRPGAAVALVPALVPGTFLS